MAHTRKSILIAAGLAAACTVTLVGVTTALWRSDLETSAEVRDGAVLFSVNGVRATAAHPQVDLEIGTAEAQQLAETGALALPIEVQALSQGNRGLDYVSSLTAIDEDSMFYYSVLGITEVESAAACTAEVPVGSHNPGTLSVEMIPATYSDTEVPDTQYYCLRADLTPNADAGTYTSTATITGTHAFGVLTHETDWEIDVLSTVTPENQPNHVLTFEYRTTRAGASS